MSMKAEIEIECKEPEKTIKSIQPDADKTEKFESEMKAAKGKINIKIKSDDIPGLLAGINSHLRLIKTTKDLEEIE